MTEHSVIDGALFLSMVKGGAAALYSDRRSVNELNVFPIPDGDTGDNMYMTIRAGASVTKDGGKLSEISSEIAHAMLLGARGNSGVILSRIFAGIADGLNNSESADIPAFSSAAVSGVKSAYDAVSTPVEGTILTVYREAAEYAASKLKELHSFEQYFDFMRDEAARSLERTPELLDVLKEAGVVDSGGAGLLSIISGMLSALKGEKITSVGENASDSHNSPDLTLFTEDTVLEYGYCTEFLLRLQNAKTDISAFDIDAFSAHLSSIGESVVAFRDGTIIKTHVHTMKPYEVLEYAQSFGEFLTVKIENMMLQHNETESKKTALKAKAKKKYGVVAVAAGDGIRSTFEAMGADKVISGGQTMNPSAKDFIDAFDEVNADTVFVFPGNGNIILTAEQAAGMYGKSDVRVVPCKTIGEIYVALSMLDLSSGDTNTIVSDAVSSLDGIVTGSVSRASRDADMNGVTVNEGDYIGYSGGKIISGGRERRDVLVSLAEKLGCGKADVLLMICGEEADDGEAREIYGALSEKYRRTEVIMINGGQPVQDYIIVLE